MLTLRAYAALAGIGLVVALALSLIALGRERAVTADLRDQVRQAAVQRREDLAAVKRLEDRNAALYAAQAETCGTELRGAFDRGVQVGRAVCEARR